VTYALPPLFFLFGSENKQDSLFSQIKEHFEDFLKNSDGKKVVELSWFVDEKLIYEGPDMKNEDKGNVLEKLDAATKWGLFKLHLIRGLDPSKMTLSHIFPDCPEKFRSTPVSFSGVIQLDKRFPDVPNLVSDHYKKKHYYIYVNASGAGYADVFYSVLDPPVLFGDQLKNINGPIYARRVEEEIKKTIENSSYPISCLFLIAPNADAHTPTYQKLPKEMSSEEMRAHNLNLVDLYNQKRVIISNAENSLPPFFFTLMKQVRKRNKRRLSASAESTTPFSPKKFKEGKDN